MNSVELMNTLKDVIAKEISDKEKTEKELADLKIKYEKLQKDHKYVYGQQHVINQKIMVLSETLSHINSHKTKPFNFVIEGI